MKILLDHCVDRRLAASLAAHEVKTAQDMGWDRLKNGELFASAAAQFDAVVTVDRNLLSQQNVAALPIAVVVMAGRSSKLSELLSLVPALEAALGKLEPCTLVEVR